MERDVKKRFRKECIKLGCIVVYFEDPLKSGAPDMLVFTPNGVALFFEFKKPGKEPRADQYRYMLDLRKMGFHATWHTGWEIPFYIVKGVVDSTWPHRLIESLMDLQVDIDIQS